MLHFAAGLILPKTKGLLMVRQSRKIQTHRKMQYLILLDIPLQVNGITSGRAAALLPAFLGLLSIIIGSVVLARSRGRIGYGRPGAITAVVLALIVIVLSVAHLISTRDSSFGTGSGRLGAIVALVLGLIGVVLGVQALARLRKGRSGGDKKML